MALDIESITSVVKEGVPALEVLAGSKAVALFIEKISGALGWYVEPMQIVRKARAEAIASLIKSTNEQEVKSLEQRTATRIISEETKRQQNMEAIVLDTLSSIKEDARPNEMDEDWLTAFFDKCRNVSNKDMQRLWSQILAGEINEPGSFSPRTINVLSTFTKEDAIIFKKLCNYVWYSNDPPIASIVTSNMIDDVKTFKLRGNEIYHLQDMNLVLYTSLGEMGLSSEEDERLFFTYHNHRFNVSKLDSDDVVSYDIENFPMGQVNLTQIGRELATICANEPNWEYMNHVVEMWRSRGYQVIEEGG